MSKANELINMFITEGLVDGNMMPAELPKLDGNLQQNKTTQTPSNKLEVPTDTKDKVPTNKPDMPKDLKDKGDKSDYKMALEASHQCLSLAEYHLGKLNKMKEIEEDEDINLDKIGAAHKIITDTKQALQEMISKYKDKSEEVKEEPKEQEPEEKKTESTVMESSWLQNPKGERWSELVKQKIQALKENKELIGASVFGIGGEEKLVNIQNGNEAELVYVLDNSDLDSIRSVRMGKADAPLFFQKGGWYYPAKALKGRSDVIKGTISFDSKSKKNKAEALNMLKQYAK